MFPKCFSRVMGVTSATAMLSGDMSYLRQVLALDEALLIRVRRWNAPSATRLMRTFTHLGDGSTWTFVAVLLVAAGGEARRLGWLVAVAAVSATLLSQTLKRVCRRPRPSTGIGGFTALAENPDAFSFPSGHTAAAFAVAIALAGEGQFLGPAQLGLAFCVAMSRVYLGAHYPLDVVAGATLGVIGGVVARLAL
jgi:undecaprenyl-diphosphatase